MCLCGCEGGARTGIYFPQYFSRFIKLRTSLKEYYITQPCLLLFFFPSASFLTDMMKLSNSPIVLLFHVETIVVISRIKLTCWLCTFFSFVHGLTAAVSCIIRSDYSITFNMYVVWRAHFASFITVTTSCELDWTRWQCTFFPFVSGLTAAVSCIVKCDYLTVFNMYIVWRAHFPSSFYS